MIFLFLASRRWHLVFGENDRIVSCTQEPPNKPPIKPICVTFFFRFPIQTLSQSNWKGKKKSENMTKQGLRRHECGSLW